MLEKYSWKCPILLCKYEATVYSQTTLDTLRRIHEKDHDDETRHNALKFDAAKLVEPPKNYNKLKITKFDAGFLKTRFIKIDSDMEIT
jgi:hypothetical protein